MTGRLVVYVAGSFRGPNAWRVEQNVRRAEEVSLALVEAGAAPLCPHTMFRHFDGALPDEVWLEVSSDLLRRCDAVFVVPDSESSEGTRAELLLAAELGLPVRSVPVGWWSQDELRRMLISIMAERAAR